MHLELPPELRAAKRAREFVAANAPPLTPASQVALRLLTSELVTNVPHARTALQVGLTVTDDCVLVTIAPNGARTAG